MSFFGDILTSLFDRAPMLRGVMPDDDKPIEVLCRDLLSSRGDVSGMSLAKLVLDRYAHFDDDQKLALFTLLSNEAAEGTPGSDSHSAGPSRSQQNHIRRRVD